jgi:hypothetical protein
LIDGEKRNVPAKEVYSQMAANNDRPIQSKAAQKSDWRYRSPRLPGGKHELIHSLRNTRNDIIRFAEEWMGTIFDKEKNHCNVSTQNMLHSSGPYPDVAKYFALKTYTHSIDISEYVEIANTCKYAGVHYNNECRETTEVNLNGKQLESLSTRYRRTRCMKNYSN